MGYIIGLVILGLFFLVLHYFTDLKNTQKAVIAGVVFSIIAGATMFNNYSANQRENMLSVVTKFNQDKTVKCTKFDVNNTNFTISIGTYTFIGKENTPHYGQMISVSECQ